MQSLTVDGVKFMLCPAGHVLGAAMVMLDIAGTRVLYTGDYSLEEDRHLMAAEPPVDTPPDVLIVESTFGMQCHESREIREGRFTGMKADFSARVPMLALSCSSKHSHSCYFFSGCCVVGAVKAAIDREGFVLLPVYALGRAQELMLILGACAACTWLVS